MFRPIAVTVVSALTGSLLLALFVVPTLCTVALQHQAKALAKEDEKQKDQKTSWFDKLRGAYGRSLSRSERYRKLILIVSIVLIGVALGSLKFIGTNLCRHWMKAPWLSHPSVYLASP